MSFEKMRTWAHTDTLAHMDVIACTWAHIYTLTHRDVIVCTWVHTYTQTHMDVIVHTWTHTYTRTHMDVIARTWTHTYTRTHVDVIVRTWVHTYTHVYACILACCQNIYIKKTSVRDQYINYGGVCHPRNCLGVCENARKKNVIRFIFANVSWNVKQWLSIFCQFCFLGDDSELVLSEASRSWKRACLTAHMSSSLFSSFEFPMMKFHVVVFSSYARVVGAMVMDFPSGDSATNSAWWVVRIRWKYHPRIAASYTKGTPYLDLYIYVV
jgi:hypothetical protein